MPYKLDPCPFCGHSEASVEDISTTRRAFFAVSCGNCEADGPVARTPDLAVEAWNTRTEPLKGDGGGTST